MKTKKFDVRIDMEPLRLEYEDGSYIVIEPLNALDLIDLTQMGTLEDATLPMRDIMIKSVVEAKIADKEWKRGDDFNEFLRILPASVYTDLVMEIMILNNLMPEQRRMLERVEEIQEKK